MAAALQLLFAGWLLCSLPGWAASQNTTCDTACQLQQRSALLYISLNGSTWSNSVNWSAQDAGVITPDAHCSWHGVLCCNASLVMATPAGVLPCPRANGVSYLVRQLVLCAGSAIPDCSMHSVTSFQHPAELLPSCMQALIHNGLRGMLPENVFEVLKYTLVVLNLQGAALASLQLSACLHSNPLLIYDLSVVLC